MKNTLKVIVALLIFIVGLISIDKFIVKDENTETKEKEESNIEIKKVELGYLVDDFVGYYEMIELNNLEKEELIKIFTSLNYKTEKIDIDLAIIPKYKLTFDDKVLYLSSGDEEYATLVQGNNEEIIATKSLKAKIKEIMSTKSIDSVYLFERYDLSTTNFVKIELSDEDKRILKERFSYTTSIEPVNLMIAGRYVLVVDGESLAFDDIRGSYAMLGSEMVMMNAELDEILDKYINDENECCSCCPDAEPDEVCISACCPCS